MINYDMIRLIAMFSVAVWALMSKTPIKSGVKRVATYVFNNTFPLREKFFSHVPFDDFEQYTVKFFATLLALFLIALAQTIDMVVLVDNLGYEWQWIADAELISAAGVISLTITKYSITYYANMVFTSVLIGVVGSAGIHRGEKWLAGNGLLFDVLRAWLEFDDEPVDDEPVESSQKYGSVTVSVYGELYAEAAKQLKSDEPKVVYRDQEGNEALSPESARALMDTMRGTE